MRERKRDKMKKSICHRGSQWGVQTIDQGGEKRETGNIGDKKGMGVGYCIAESQTWTTL